MIGVMIVEFSNCKIIELYWLSLPLVMRDFHKWFLYSDYGPKSVDLVSYIG